MKKLSIILLSVCLFSCAVQQPMQRKYVLGQGFITEWQPVNFKKHDTIIFTKNINFKNLKNLFMNKRRVKNESEFGAVIEHPDVELEKHGLNKLVKRADGKIKNGTARAGNLEDVMEAFVKEGADGFDLVSEGTIQDPELKNRIEEMKGRHVQFDDILLSDIIPDPNQPRHYYSPADEVELMDSVRSKGVLQAILVRPHASGKYMIVFGERRWRAAISVSAEFPERNTIPANIRMLDDEETLELQIIENLQRKDIQPMEEAVAFKSLNSKLTTEEIALRVGKSPQYVAQRMTLTNLIQDFQEMLFQHKMKLVQAYKLCRLTAESQASILKDALSYHKDWRKQNDYELGNIDHYVSRELLDLSKAPFKTTDPTLNPEMGACTTCPFNTANSPLLFPELNKKRFCNYAVCYQIKTNRSFQRKIENVLLQPEVLLVNCSSYLSDSEKKKVKSVEEIGATVLDHDLFKVVKKPEPVLPWEEYLKEADHWSNDYDFTPEEKAEQLEECRQEYDDEVSQYQQDIAEYEENISSGRTKKAFVVAGDYNTKEGQLVDIVISPKKGAVLPAGVTTSTINTTVEIAAIEEREKRNREVDREKVFKQSMAALKEPFFNITDPLHYEEVKALVILLIDTSYKARDVIEKEFGTGNDYNRIQAYKKLLPQRIDSPTITRLIRIALYDKLYSPTELDYNSNGKAAAIYDLAKLWIPDQVKGFELEQKLKSAKRISNVQKRIAALKGTITAAAGQQQVAGNQEADAGSLDTFEDDLANSDDDLVVEE